MKPQGSQQPAAKVDYIKPNLDALYKPVGIQAITAAAICKGVSGKAKPAGK